MNKILFIIFLLFSFVFISSKSVYSQTENPIPKALSRNLLQCSERLWPKLAWKKVQILWVDSSHRKAFLWNDQQEEQRGSWKEISYKELPTSFQNKESNFSFENWKGVETLAVQNEGSYKTVPEWLLLALHEGFHHFSQKELEALLTQNKKLKTFRGHFYPEDFKPRYLRNQIIHALKKSFVEPTIREEYLQAAAYWKKEWETQYPQDVERTRNIDLIEGTAQYVGALGARLGLLGCEASEEELMKAVQTYIQSRPRLNENFWKVDEESYLIGFYAGLLLREKNSPHWELQIQKGQSFLDLLLSSEAALAQEDNLKIKKQISDFYEKDQKGLEKKVEPFLSKFHSEDYNFLVIPFTWNHSAYSIARFVNVLRDGALRKLLIQVSTQIEFPNSPTLLKIKDEEAEESQSTPCGEEPSLIIPLPKKTILEAQNSESVKIKSAHFSLKSDLPWKDLISKDQDSYLCLKH